MKQQLVIGIIYCRIFKVLTPSHLTVTFPLSRELGVGHEIEI